MTWNEVGTKIITMTCIHISYPHIHQYRELLYELAFVGMNEETPAKKSSNWKRACASILIQTVNIISQLLLM